MKANGRSCDGVEKNGVTGGEKEHSPERRERERKSWRPRNRDTEERRKRGEKNFSRRRWRQRGWPRVDGEGKGKADRKVEKREKGTTMRIYVICVYDLNNCLHNITLLVAGVRASRRRPSSWSFN